jgi:metal-responsive CopG/Arc/MetJ family transcriptional regulator
MAKASLTIQMEPELLAKLDAAAKAQRRSRSSMISVLVEAALVAKKGRAA